MNRLFKENRGFTLIELLIVVAITLVLGAIAIMSFTSYVDKSKKTVSIAGMDRAVKFLSAFAVEHQGSYPATFNDTTCTDEEGREIMTAANCSQFRKELFSIVSYTPNADRSSFTLVGTALDSGHTVITATPMAISY